MVKCQVVMDAMERIAPRRLAEDWDNPGLLLGSPAQEVSRIFVCLDVDEAAVDAAVRQGADMIESHHPLIFRAMKQLRTDLPLGRLLQRLSPTVASRSNWRAGIGCGSVVGMILRLWRV